MKAITDYLNAYEKPADRLANVLLFRNGLHAAFDSYGCQIPELQQADNLTLAIKLADDRTRWCGFKTIPGGAKGVLVP